MSKALRIAYMGTPEFAVPPLEKLVKSEYNVVAVITAPDKPSGRGQKVNCSAVKLCAEKYGLKILQPTNLKNPSFQEELKSLQANLQIVVAFRMLPEAVWNMPSIGTFNLHASLLPAYRGAAPINWAIINGEKETGLTTFFLKHEIDTGDVILQEKEPILESDNVGSLYERLMIKGGDLVLKTVQLIESESYELKPQAGDIIEAPKIFKDTCEINWSKSSAEIHNFVRGLSPYPVAWTNINGKTHKIFRSEIEGNDTIESLYETDNKSYLKIKTADGSLSIHEIQAQGKKRMTISEYLRGNKL